jgi:alkylhydroperoxidase/carboxymuconolactone decarboxylase family protein YurZ
MSDIDLSEDMPLLSELLSMTVESAERSGLDPATYLRVRIAALAAMGANPGSWILNLAAAADAGLTIEDVQAVLISIAPVIGTPRTAAAAGNALRALGLAALAADDEA